MSDLRSAIENLGRAGRRGLGDTVHVYAEAAHRADNLSRRAVWQAFADLIADVDRQPRDRTEVTDAADRHPQMIEHPERADLLALLRAHLREDEDAMTMILMEARLDPYEVIAMLCGLAVLTGSRATGSPQALDEWLAAEQRAELT